MQQSKTQFLLVFSAICLGFVVTAGAATPSVRILGSGAGYSGSRVPAGTGLTSAKKVANTGATQAVKSTQSGAQAVKSATTMAAKNAITGVNAKIGGQKAAAARMGTPKTVTAPSVSQAASNRIGLTLSPQPSTAKVGTERFPGIATKTNIQSVNKINALSSSAQAAAAAATGYNIKDIDDRLSGVQDILDTKVDTLTLSDYYTKDYIDSSYYTKQAIDDYFESFQISPSYEFSYNLSQNLSAITGQLGQQAADIAILKEQGILDLNTETRKSLRIYDSFDDEVLDTGNESNEG